jgi:hypothetical protein
MARVPFPRRLWPPLLLVALVLPASPHSRLAATSAAPANGPYPGFEVRYGIGPLPARLSSLVGRNEPISAATDVFREPSGGRYVLEGLGEGQAIYDVSLEALFAVLSPDPGRKAFGPGVLENHVEEFEGNRALVFQVVGAEFLGVKLAFETRSEVFWDSFPDGSVGIRSRLVGNPDGKLYESYNSWYLAPIEVEGRTMTYMRFYIRSGIYDPFPGAESVMKLFLPRQLSDMFSSNVREARKALAVKR